MASNPGRPVPKPRWLFAQSPDSLGIHDRPATSATASHRAPHAFLAPTRTGRPLEPLSTWFEAPRGGKR
jgi:hypothetical protein